MSDENLDRRTIRQWLRHIGCDKEPSFPEDHNRTTPEIDAEAGHFLIEHTEIASYGGQHKGDAKFAEFANNLETKYSTLKFRLLICFSPKDFQKCKNVRELVALFENWVHEDVSRLVNGKRERITLPGFPYTFDATRNDQRPGGLMFARYAPGEGPPIHSHLPRKLEKLANRRQEGCVTVLLVESVDIALMNESKAQEMIQLTLHSVPEHEPDQIWFVHRFDRMSPRVPTFTRLFTTPSSPQTPRTPRPLTQHSSPPPAPALR